MSKSSVEALRAHRERARLYRKTEAYREYINAYAKKRYQKNKVQHTVWAKVRTAVRNGDLVKPDNCVSCQTVGHIEAHHDDYNKPLVVTWLCKPCHQNLHGRIRDKALLAKGDSNV